MALLTKEGFKITGWTIQYNPKPIPDRSHDYDFWHEDIDIDRPDLCGTARSIGEAILEIECREYSNWDKCI